MRIKILIASVLVIAGATGVYYAFFDNPQTQARRSNVRAVKVEPVRTREFADQIEAIGTLAANEFVTLTAKTQGIIRALHFDDSQIVKKGEEIAAIDAGEQDAQLRVEIANLDQQKRTLERSLALAKDQHVSQARVDELESAVKRAEATVAAASVRAGDRRIVAPFSGIIGIRKISLGALVSPGTAIATLDDISTMKVDIAVPETFISALKPGLAVEAKASAYRNEVFKGTVASIDTRIDPVTRTVTVRAQIPNAELKLRPGMLMVAQLIKDARTSLVVPETALVPENDLQQVYVIAAGKGPNSVANKVDVKLGTRLRGVVEIVSGLKEGDLVIVEGMQDLPSGAPVKVVTPEGAPDAAGRRNGQPG